MLRFALLPDAAGVDGAMELESACQCFPEHCPANDIAVAIGRGIEVWLQCQDNARLTDLFTNLRNIPTPPRLYFEIRDELNSPSGDARSVAAIIGRDPAVSAKILKVANSGFYAVPRSVTDMRDAGEKLEVRVKAISEQRLDITDVLAFRMPLADGGSIALADLAQVSKRRGLGNIRHYNFRRAITVEADLEQGVIDTVSANNLLMIFLAIEFLSISIDLRRRKSAAIPDDVAARLREAINAHQELGWTVPTCMSIPTRPDSSG